MCKHGIFEQNVALGLHCLNEINHYRYFIVKKNVCHFTADFYRSSVHLLVRLVCCKKKKNYVAVQLPLIGIQITACYLKSENIDYGNAAANNLM